MEKNSDRHGDVDTPEPDPAAPAGQDEAASAAEPGERSAREREADNEPEAAAETAAETEPSSEAEHDGHADDRGHRPGAVPPPGPRQRAERATAAARTAHPGPDQWRYPEVPPTHPHHQPRPRRVRRPLPATPLWLPRAVLVVGVVAALLIPPEHEAGLGLLIAGTVAVAAVFPLVRDTLSLWTIVYGVLAGVLLSTVIVRDADWVIFAALTGAFVLASLAVALRVPGAGTRWPELLGGGLALVREAVAVPRFLTAPLRSADTHRRWLPVLGGIGATVVLLTVFGLLFASADPVFAQFVTRLFVDVDGGSLPGRTTVAVLFVLGTGAAALAALRPVPPRPDVPADPSIPRPAVPTVVWMLPLGALNLLFVAFVALQARTVLFGGAEYVHTTTGLTYAEYARQGFFQLLTAGFLVLAVTAAACRLLRSERGARRRIRNLLLGALCLLTLLLLASALHRLGLYSDTFGLTRMRVMAEAAIWWIGAVFVLVLAAGAVDTYGERAGWLPRAVVAVSGVGLALFAYSNPELRIAESQLDRPADDVDLYYLSDLSADSLPALVRIVEKQDCLRLAPAEREELRAWLAEGEPWTAWNAARQEAVPLLRGLLDDFDEARRTPEPCPLGTDFLHLSHP